jgi:hypothetical protein
VRGWKALRPDNSDKKPYLLFTDTYSPILFIGSLFTCYAIVKLFTKQSGKNAVVLISSIVAAIAAFAVGPLLYMMIGYMGLYRCRLPFTCSPQYPS